MRRRGGGIAALKRKQALRRKQEAKKNEIEATERTQVSKLLQHFRKNLERFALDHKKKINEDPEFRRHFQKMCANIGVDPLASNKGFWAELLGMNDFYYELGVQTIDICLATRGANGGLMKVSTLYSQLNRLRGSAAQRISCEDIEQSIRKLKVLGSGFDILRVGSNNMVVSVPVELNTDHTLVLTLGQKKGYVTRASIAEQLSWKSDRIDMVLQLLMKEGMAWIDTQAKDGLEQYWFPSLFKA